MHQTPHNRYLSAAIQFEPRLGHKEENIVRLLALTETAATAGARVIVLPEMATTGYCWLSRAEVAPYVEPIPGPTTARFAALCARYGCYVAIGMPEVEPDTGVFYNAMALVGPQGLVGKYRKTHAFVAEPKWAKDGDLGFPVWETEYGVLGGMICMDASYFEPARLLALQGADVILFPTNWLGEKSPSAFWLSRAYENGVYLVAANRYGWERGTQFSGGSAVIGPDGGIIACQDSGDGIVYGEIDLGRARQKRFAAGDEHKLRDRRPDCYPSLVLNTYLWHPTRFFGLHEQPSLPGRAGVNVAVLQYAPGTDETENWAGLERELQQLATAGAGGGPDLVVAPELALTGALDADRAGAMAEPVPGPRTARLADLACRYQACLVTTVPERSGDALYHTVVLVGAAGLLRSWPQAHLDQIARRWATAGASPPVWCDLPVGRVGLLGGYDSLFPESAMELAANGTDIVAIPAARPDPAPIGLGPTAVPLPAPILRDDDQSHWHYWRVLAWQSNVWIALANPGGYSGIFSPDTMHFPKDEACCGPAGPPEAALHRIDTSPGPLPETYTNPVKTKALVSMRQPIWYDPLVATRWTQ